MRYRGGEMSGLCSRLIKKVWIEVLLRIAQGSRFCIVDNKGLSNRFLSRYTKLQLHKTVVRTVVLYDCETWRLTHVLERSLEVFRKRNIKKNLWSCVWLWSSSLEKKVQLRTHILPHICLACGYISGAEFASATVQHRPEGVHGSLSRYCRDERSTVEIGRSCS